MKTNNIYNKKQRGISLILTLLVLSGVFSIAFGMSSIILSELRFGRTVGHSVPSFFAADSGIEKVLTDRESPSNIPSTQLGNGATFEVTVTPSGPDCSADNYCIESTGEFGSTKRAIEITY